MAATIIVILLVGLLLVLAVRYLLRHGMCAACENSGACKGASGSGCDGNCSACRCYASELEARKSRVHVK